MLLLTSVTNSPIPLNNGLEASMSSSSSDSTISGDLLSSCLYSFANSLNPLVNWASLSKNIGVLIGITALTSFKYDSFKLKHHPSTNLQLQSLDNPNHANDCKLQARLPTIHPDLLSTMLPVAIHVHDKLVHDSYNFSFLSTALTCGHQLSDL